MRAQDVSRGSAVRAAWSGIALPRRFQPGRPDSACAGCWCSQPYIGKKPSVVQDDGQKRRIDVDARFEVAVVLNEAEPLELVHEKVHARASGPDHLRERFL